MTPSKIKPKNAFSLFIDKALFFILSSPSGAGKDAVLKLMKKSSYPLTYITTVTTRAKRTHEKEGIDYHFVTDHHFHKMIANNELLEWAEVYGNRYGVPRKPVEKALDEGKDVIVKVDVQGAITIKKQIPQAILIFMTPPTTEELTTRLRKRRTETGLDLARRLQTAEQELKQISIFDYLVINYQGKLGLTTATIKSIIAAEKHRVKN